MKRQYRYTATIYYNEARDEHGRSLAMLRGYQPGDELRKVARLKVWGTGPEATLDDIYRLMNVVDGTELPAALRIRSMSVGDVATVELDGEPVCSWAVAGVGWEPLRTSELNTR